ncbi:hypothetical protein NQ317_019536 [Molorchus minor]|uniref:Uncharacterized protein n=1 Tax=Molorchus minor TaxID=1323400 RepID=A0ABQ9J0N0_9CUCU|nr:hypothetical protein NQ317_019536 [Molorchus minor]
MSLKRDSLEKKRRCSRTKAETKVDEDTQFGFENRAFMSQHIYLDNKFEADPPRCPSLAQFVEGNDIARRSFKRQRPTTKLSKTEANVNRQSTLMEETEATTPSNKGSQGSLNKMEKELSNVSTSTLKALEQEKDNEDAADRLSTSDVTTSNNSSNSNLLGIDNEQFLTRSPAATRRISCCSMLNQAETAALAAAATTTKFYSESEREG